MNPELHTHILVRETKFAGGLRHQQTWFSSLKYGMSAEKAKELVVTTLPYAPKTDRAICPPSSPWSKAAAAES